MKRMIAVLSLIVLASVSADAEEPKKLLMDTYEAAKVKLGIGQPIGDFQNGGKGLLAFRLFRSLNADGTENAAFPVSMEVQTLEVGDVVFVGAPPHSTEGTSEVATETVQGAARDSRTAGAASGG